MQTQEVKTAEIVAIPVNDMQGMVKAQDLPLLRVMETMDSLDWKALKPHQTALLLMQKPIPSGGGTIFLSFRQAILFATRCFELGVSPFSSEVWYDPNRAVTNLTLEGKRMVARNRGVDLGPPQFEEIERDWAKVPRMSENGEAARKAGFATDIGVKCKIRVGDPKLAEHAEYTAYLSEWYVPKSPVWQAKPMHMLQTRACEKAISMALGTGSSDPIAE